MGWRTFAAVAVAVLFAVPLLFVVSGSLRPSGLPPPRTPELLPSPRTLANYRRTFQLVDLRRQLLNSVTVVAVAVPVTVIVSSWTGYALARLPKRWSNPLIALSVIVLVIPGTALIVSRFVLYRRLGLTDTLWPLVMPSLIGTSPFYALLFWWSFRRLPPELLDAARLEGCSELGAWYRVALPLVNPTMVAVALLTVVTTWGNFLDPLIYITDERDFTVSLGLRALAGLDRQDFPLFLAGSVVATAPVVLALALLGRYLFSDQRGALWQKR